jgi:hypothetical protein
MDARDQGQQPATADQGGSVRDHGVGLLASMRDGDRDGGKGECRQPRAGLAQAGESAAGEEIVPAAPRQPPAGL